MHAGRVNRLGKIEALKYSFGADRCQVILRMSVLGLGAHDQGVRHRYDFHLAFVIAEYVDVKKERSVKIRLGYPGEADEQEQVV